MELRDDQVERYSRQLLLREIGGGGQRALLSAAVELHGEGAALEVALAYLAASGVAVEAAAPRSAVGEWNPDARGPRPGAVRVQLGAGPLGSAQVRAPAVWVGGTTGGALRVWGLPAGGCIPCAVRALAGLGPVPPGPLSVVAGAHAALAVQRLVLGWHGQAVSGMEVGLEGETRPVGWEGCGEHGR
jgi:hypothetical protein